MAARLALKLGCTIPELLARIDSRDLAEWQAFELAHGPIDDSWRDMILVEIHYQLQLANTLFISSHSEDELEDPPRLPLPWQMIQKREGDM